MRRGEIYLVNLPYTGSSIQGGGIRPMIIVSNSMCCKHSSVLHAIPVTTQSKRRMPTHVEIPTSTGLTRPSTAMCEQTMLLSIESFITKVGHCDNYIMDKVDRCIAVQFGLDLAYA